jgi:release factor glutamine methyltransferase
VQLRQVLREANTRLAAAGVGSPRLNTETLLMFTLGVDRAYLYAHPERELTSEEISRYHATLRERERGVPAQYITGHQEFWGLDFIVTPAVLVPRPETEHVIETVLPLARDIRAPRIVDVGTGSGCIAVALASELPDAVIDATDLSATALEIARANAARHGFEKRIIFREADLIGDLQPQPYNFIVSNPPYVRDAEEDQVQLEVRKFEPRSAVFAGPTGLEVIQRLIPHAWLALEPGGWLVFEISGTIAEGVRRLLTDWENVALIPDLQGIPRVACAQKPDSNPKNI